MVRRSWRIPSLIFLRLILIASCTAVFYIEGFFFLKEERILLLFPWLARYTSVAELAKNGQEYDGRWIRTEGRITSIKEATAILKVSIASEEEPSILLHNLPVLGMYTSSLTSLTNDQTIEVAGEWERGTGVFQILHLDIVGVIKPIQTRYLFSILWVLALVPGVAVPTLIVFLPRRAAKNMHLLTKQSLIR